MQGSNSSDLLKFFYDENGVPYAVQATNGFYYYVYNLQGDVIALLDVLGNKVVEYEYNAWGELLSVTGSKASTIGNLNPFRYRGYYYDTETGFYFCGSRYYDSVTCRFISPDTTDVLTATPMGLTDKNLYAYCDNNPVMRSDHGGEFWNVIAGAVIGGAINLVSTATSVIVEKVKKKESITLKDIGKIVLSTAIGAAEGAAMAFFPGASAAIGAVASAADTAISGFIDGDSIGDIVTNSIVSGTIGAVTGSGGSDFVKGGKLINDAAGSIGNAVKKGIHPVAKKAARKTVKKAVRSITRSYLSGQAEDFAYGGIYEFSSRYVRRCRR